MSDTPTPRTDAAWKTGNLGHAEAISKDIETELAFAREDGERLDWLEKIAADEAGNVIKISRFTNGFTHLVLGHDPLAITLNGLRSAIDSARGVSTTPPASGEAEPASTSRWTYSSYRAALYLDGKPWAIVSPDMRNALSESDADLLLRAMNNLPLPPPPTQDGKEQGK